jgi:hypothetical protein
MGATGVTEAPRSTKTKSAGDPQSSHPAVWYRMRRPTKTLCTQRMDTHAVRSFRALSEQESNIHQALVERVAAQLSEFRRLS